MVRRTVGHLGCEIEIEPGRLIAGNAGVLLARVIYLKRGEGRDFLILDAAMNDLIRPAMYDAWHDIVPVVEPAAGAELAPVDVVGPVCETGDTFARRAALPPLGAGRPGGLPLGGRLRRGDGVGIQLAAAGAGGAGARAITSPWCGRGRALTKCSNRDTIPDWIGTVPEVRATAWRDREGEADEGRAAGRPRTDPLARVIRRSRAAMALESFTRAFWPLGSALAALWAALAFGLAEVATRDAAARRARRWPGLALLALLVSGHPPLPLAEPRRRRGRGSTRRCRGGRSPRCATRRRSGRDDPGAQAVWAAHLARMRRLAATARPVRADLRLASRDPWALRLMALVLLIAALRLRARPRRRVGRRGAAAGAGRGGRGRAELRGLGRAAGLYRAADALSAGGAGRASRSRCRRAPG